MVNSIKKTSWSRGYRAACWLVKFRQVPRATLEYVLHVTPVSGRFRVNRYYTLEIDGLVDQAGNPISAPVFRAFRAVAR